jgi:hypothetical protein
MQSLAHIALLRPLTSLMLCCLVLHHSQRDYCQIRAGQYILSFDAKLKFLWWEETLYETTLATSGVGCPALQDQNKIKKTPVDK